MNTVTVIYKGAYSAIGVPEISRMVDRGVPFEAPRDWAERIVESDPDSWEIKQGAAVPAPDVAMSDEAEE